FLIAFVAGRQLPAELQFIRPDGFLRHLRIGVLLLWEVLLAYGVIFSLSAGDAGMIFTGTLAAALLLLLIAAPPKSTADKPAPLIS
ncbi:MAG TPA: hypothetical protein VIS74_06140, partial [Chthoniobacterales bacterium]